MIRALLNLVPSDGLQAGLAAYDRWEPIVVENQHALKAARDCLDAGLGPIRAAKAFAQATTTPLDDAAAAELESLARQAVTVLAVVCTAAAALAEAEPRFRSGVNAGFTALFGAAYRAAAWKHTVETEWLNE